MKVEQSKVTKLRITEVENLDPITVFLEDFGPGKGQITIQCYGKSWTSYWGAMDGRTIAEFFCDSDEHYIAKNLSQIDASVPDYEALAELAKAEVCKLRMARELDHREARRLFDEINDSPLTGDDDEAKAWLTYDQSIMSEIFGYEWWCSIPWKANPEYEYLCRIILAVQAAIKSAGNGLI